MFSAANKRIYDADQSEMTDELERRVQRLLRTRTGTALHY